MQPSDSAAVVAIQEAFLHGSVITAFGARFLRRFHLAALGHPATSAHVAIGDGACVGFVVGSSDVHGFNRRTKLLLLPWLATALLPVKRWRLIGPVLRSLTEHEPQPPIPAELLLLVVDRRVRRQSVGRRLLAAFEADLASAGVSTYRVAVRSELVDARRFYQALGFESEQELSVLGRPMTYLTKRIAP